MSINGFKKLVVLLLIIVHLFCTILRGESSRFWNFSWAMILKLRWNWTCRHTTFLHLHFHRYSALKFFIRKKWERIVIKWKIKNPIGSVFIVIVRLLPRPKLEMKHCQESFRHYRIRQKNFKRKYSKFGKF